MVRPQRICPDYNAAALLLLLLLQLLQLPVDPNSKLTIRKQHMHWHIRVPQACTGVEGVRRGPRRRAMQLGDLALAACSCDTAWRCCNGTPLLSLKQISADCEGEYVGLD
jgi:hypothetical protein